MDSQAQEATYNRTVLDARGFATPTGGTRRHLWAISGFEVAAGAIISVVATCFDSAIWVGRCTAADVVAQLAEDLGAVLTERELLDFLQEALSPTAPTAPGPGPSPGPSGTTANRQHSGLPPQLSRSASQPPQAGNGGNGGDGGGGFQPSQRYGYGQSQPLSQQQQQLSHGQLRQQQQQPALTLHLTRDTGAGPPVEDAGGDSTFVSVTLPPSRFDGSEVVVRLPTRGGMVRVSGPEAPNACLTLVANLTQQLDEQRDEMESLVSELSRTAEENRLLRAQLAAAAASGGGNGNGGATLRDQYGLAGAPQPAPSGAAKRLRNAGSGGGVGSLLLQVQLQAAAAAAVATGGDGGEFAVAALSQQCLSQQQSQSQPQLAPAYAGLTGVGVSQSAATAARAASQPPPGYGPGLGSGRRPLGEDVVVGGSGAAVAASQAAAPTGEAAGGRAADQRVRDATARGGGGASGDREGQDAPQQQRRQAEEGVGGGSEAEPPVSRDPSRVGVTIRRTGAGGRGALGRGGRTLPRR